MLFIIFDRLSYEKIEYLDGENFDLVSFALYNWKNRNLKNL